MLKLMVVVQEWSNATPGIECSEYGINSIKSALLSFFRVSAFFFFKSIKPSSQKTMSKMIPVFKKLMIKAQVTII